MSVSTATPATISVIVPTRDRPARLEDCLRALSGQDYPRARWEAVVVDDGSEDATRVASAVDSVRDRIDVRLVAQENAGPAAARNVGASHARFDYLAFTDDDCLPRPGWLSGLAAAFEHTPRGVLGGHVVNGLEELPCSEASQQLVDYVVDYFLETGAPFFPSNNLALPRSAFEAVDGFDVRFPLAAGEDRDLCAKCREVGFPLIPVPMAVVEHRHALHLRTFWRQHFNYGRGAFVCRQLESARSAPDFRIEPVRFYLDLIRAPYRADRSARGRFRLSSLLFVSQVANAAGFFWERFSGGGHEGAGSPS